MVASVPAPVADLLTQLITRCSIFIGEHCHDFLLRTAELGALGTLEESGTMEELKSDSGGHGKHDHRPDPYFLEPTCRDPILATP